MYKTGKEWRKSKLIFLHLKMQPENIDLLLTIGNAAESCLCGKTRQAKMAKSREGQNSQSYTKHTKVKIDSKPTHL